MIKWMTALAVGESARTDAVGSVGAVTKSSPLVWLSSRGIEISWWKPIIILRLVLGATHRILGDGIANAAP